MRTALSKKKPLLSKAREFTVIMLIIFVLFFGALIIVSFWEEDIEAKNNYPYAREEVGRMRELNHEQEVEIKDEVVD